MVTLPDAGIPATLAPITGADPLVSVRISTISMMVVSPSVVIVREPPLPLPPKELKGDRPKPVGLEAGPADTANGLSSSTSRMLMVRALMRPSSFRSAVADISSPGCISDGCILRTSRTWVSSESVTFVGSGWSVVGVASSSGSGNATMTAVLPLNSVMVPATVWLADVPNPNASSPPSAMISENLW